MIVAAQERPRAFRARNGEYLRVGHDRLAAARSVVDSAGPLNGLALDVGTGKGLLTIELARHGTDVVSIDVDAEARELARLPADEARLKGRIAHKTEDAARLPLFYVRAELKQDRRLVARASAKFLVRGCI